jgi:hypothetical protein
MTVKISGFMTIKNEWPLAAVSIAHALINNVDNMYVVDNGSQDGTWQGLKILQEIFPNRLDLIYYESDEFNQRAIAHSLGHLANSDESHWGVFLDADEFLIYENPKVSFRQFLSMTNLDWTALVVDVENWIPTVGFQEDDLEAFTGIKYRSENYYRWDQLEQFRSESLAGECYWQTWKTQHKVLINMNCHKRLGHAAHQVDFGDGEWMTRHDSGTAEGSKGWGLSIAHLPYTSTKRLKNRLVLNHTEKYAENTRFFNGRDFDSASENFINALIDENSKLFKDSLEQKRIIWDTRFSESVKSAFPPLTARWQEIISACYVESNMPDNSFSKLVEMSAEYLEILDFVWKGKR